MPLTITHAFVSQKADGSDTTLVRPSNWNANHTITGTVDETMLSLTDITTGNTSISAHGFAPKLPNDGTLFLSGLGTWLSPIASITESEITLSDVTTDNVTTAHHGFTPKLPNDATKFLDGTGAWTVPSGDDLLSSNNTWTGTNIFSFQGSGSLVVPFKVSSTINGDTAEFCSVSINSTITTGALTNYQGLIIDALYQAGGTIQNATGLLIYDFSAIELGATGDCWNLYSVGSWSQNKFEGGLVIGSTADATPIPIYIHHNTGTSTTAPAIRIDSVSGSPGCGGSILWTDNNDILNMAWISGQDDDNWGGRLVFATAPQTNSSPGGTPVERMRIDNQGRVGIGTTSPNHVLEVAGDTFLAGTVYLGEYPSCPNAKVTVYQTDLSDNTNSSMLDVWASNSVSMTDMTSMVLLAQSNADVTDKMIGLYARNDINSGTTATSATIFVDSPQVSGSVTNLYGLYIADQTISGNPSAVNLFSAGAGLNVFQGNVGIATTSPDSPLTVAPVISTRTTGHLNVVQIQPQMNDDSDTFNALVVQAISTHGHQSSMIGLLVDIANLIDGATGDNVYGLYVADQTVETGTATGNVLNIYSQGATSKNVFDGSIGIGTLTPHYKLDVNGNVNVTGGFYQGVNTVSSSATPVFDCSLGNIQTITLTGDVTSSTTTNLIAGQEITFVVVQDSSGGHQFVWPANVFGAIEVGTDSSAVSVQTFISVDGTNLHASSIGVIS